MNSERRHHLALSLGLLATAPLVSLGLGGCARRESAPDVTYTLLDGAKGSLKAQQGKVVLVNFWATSCTTCVKEMPEIVATHEKFKARGYDTVAVAMSYDPPAYVASFAETRKLPFGVAIDNTGAVAQAFGDVRLTPTTFLLDKRGGIVKKYVGAPDFAALHGLIEDLLKEA
ncbi:MAG: TlpA family protein disulfide reductase [Vitreoscilla sp.]|nr:TlpA family protein disulfide reductase [Vitreoscilla sp.]